MSLASECPHEGEAKAAGARACLYHSVAWFDVEVRDNEGYVHRVEDLSPMSQSGCVEGSVESHSEQVLCTVFVHYLSLEEGTLAPNCFPTKLEWGNAPNLQSNVFPCCRRIKC